MAAADTVATCCAHLCDGLFGSSSIGFEPDALISLPFVPAVLLRGGGASDGRRVKNLIVFVLLRPDMRGAH
jgi:hypothetical protein